MDFRIDLAVIEILPKGSRFGLTLHNLSEKSVANWQLNFAFDRHIEKTSLSHGTLKQVGSLCSLSINNTPLYANNHCYVEFAISTSPFKLLSDGIKEAYLTTDSGTQCTVSVSPIVLKEAIDQPTEIPSVKAARHKLIPEPMSANFNSGVYELTRYSQITVDNTEFQSAANWLAEEVTRLFSIESKSIGQQDIHFRYSPVLDSEEYKLIVNDNGVVIESTSQSGFIYGAATLIQLMDFDAARHTLYIPFCQIHDKPRFAYRGMMIDSARSFQPVEDIKRLINLFAHYKLNTFHWHLTDDEGWRVEIKALPELTEIGAWRGPNETLEAQFHHINQRYGGFYSQEEIKDVVAFAAQRGIQVIPEIDIPGHCRAAIKSLPHMLVDPDDRSIYRSVQHYNDNTLSPGIDGTYHFLDIVLEEISELFPAPYVHIGADEVPVGVWEKSPSCQALMETHGYNSSKELQGHLLRYAEDKLKSLGKRMLGWEEAHFGHKVSKDTVIYSWLSEEAAINCAKLGYDVVLQPGQTTYLDMAQDHCPTEPGVDWANVITLEQAYLYEPLSELSSDDPIKKRILGMQAALWTEIVSHQQRLDYMIFPRLLALAETAWCPENRKNYSAFLARLKAHLSLLQRQGVQYRDPWTQIEETENAHLQTNNNNNDRI
ncbi:beta-N-acetylhexosaminidase [Vibrio mediterranei]|uniref:beta-N-acetylhexosaminidase n=1 Tax=Vibrio mediterranei TaxID=689 RepID=A0AAN1KMZ8_9VIBR|nr:family 20 glycosylhydrolase [Vibrio mediterranei]ASI89862.1 beta-hexosaminidase [Vibrio mediterranei]